MRGFWFRIALGALLVFVAGMTAIHIARRHAVEPARQAILAASTAPASPGPAAAPINLAGLREVALQPAAISQSDGPVAFVLEGQELGQVTRLFAERRSAGERASFTLTVRLFSPASIPRLLGCDLVPNHQGDDDFDFESGFRCLERGEKGYEPVGLIRFLPGDMTRQIKMRASALENLERGDPFKVNVDLSKPVRVHVEGDKGEKLAIHAADGQALMQARDAHGRERFKLVADSSGAFMQVVDDQGRVIFRMAANESGVTMTGKK